MILPLRLITMVVACLAYGSPEALAGSVVLYPTKDATVFQAEPATNRGDDTDLRILTAFDSFERFYVQFDMNQIPSGATITQATLRLYCTHAEITWSSFALHVDAVTESWSESGITWSNRPTDAYALPNQSVPITTGWVTADVTDFVQQWYEQSEGHGGWVNNGMYIQGAGATDHVALFSSRESSTNKPELVVDYEGGSTGGGGGTGDQWDPGDDNWLNRPTTLTPACTSQTHGPHTLSASDPRDTFKFRLTKGHTYKFSGTGGSGDTYATLGILAGGPILIRAEDDDSGDGSHFSITITPSEPANSDTTADWILEVTTYSEGANASYSLQYQEINCGGGGGGSGGGGGGCSNPPAPHSPWPSNGATGVNPDFWTQLDWAPVSTSYDIYFGTSSSPPFLETQNTSNTDNWLNLVP